MKAERNSQQISVPVGVSTLDRIFNVLGQPIDEIGPVDDSETLPIHRSAPAFTNFETGMKIRYEKNDWAFRWILFGIIGRITLMPLPAAVVGWLAGRNLKNY